MSALPEAALEYRAYGGALLNRGLLVAAGEEFRHWLAVVEPLGDPNLVLPPLNALCTVGQARLDFDGALQWVERALPYLQHPQVDPVHSIKTHINRLLCLLRTGRDQEAMAAVMAAQDLVDHANSPYLAGVVCLNLSSLHGSRQEWMPMRRSAQTALTYFQQAGDGAAMAQALSNLAVAHFEMGAVRLARRDLQRVLRMLEGSGGREAAYTYTELGRVLAEEGDVAGAADCATRSLDILLSDVACVDKDEVARISELFGRLFIGAGERNLALKYLNRAAAYFSQLGRVPEWRRVTEAIAGVLTVRRRGSGARLQDDAQRLDFLTTVLDLNDELESVDSYLRGHSERVAGLAVILGRAAGLNSLQLRILNYAARLHDVGKVAVDVQILQKPGALTPAEWERIQMHPLVGEEMVRPHGLPTEGVLAIRQHHEAWAGGGYPDGLRGDQISPLARFIAVADVYDALTSDRAYRRALGHAQALELIRSMSGVQLDPQLVGLLTRLHQV